MSIALLELASRPKLSLWQKFVSLKLRTCSTADVCGQKSQVERRPAPCCFPHRASAFGKPESRYRCGAQRAAGGGGNLALSFFPSCVTRESWQKPAKCGMGAAVRHAGPGGKDTFNGFRIRKVRICGARAKLRGAVSLRPEQLYGVLLIAGHDDVYVVSRSSGLTSGGGAVSVVLVEIEA